MVSFNSFDREPAILKEKILLAGRRVLESGHYILGREVSAFETLWAAACGSRYAVGVGNGMDAIEIILRSAGISIGDEVITTPMTAFATVLAILRTGATPIFADIDPQTALISIESAREKITARTRAILLVHLYGRLDKMTAWRNLCGTQNLLLIEDCAQAHLATWEGVGAGSFGIAGAYSFYPTKNLGALGDAGAIVTNSQEIDAMARRLRNYGQSERYKHPEFGLNSRLDEMQAAILSEKLSYLEASTNSRRITAAKYDNHIKNDFVRLLARPTDPQNHVYHLYAICSDFRQSLQQHLKNRGVETLIHYPVPTYKQDGFYKNKIGSIAPSVFTQKVESMELARKTETLEHCERHAESCLSLPCHPFLTEAEVSTVIEAVNCFTPDVRSSRES